MPRHQHGFVAQTITQFETLAYRSIIEIYSLSWGRLTSTASSIQTYFVISKGTDLDLFGERIESESELKLILLKAFRPERNIISTKGGSLETMAEPIYCYISFLTFETKITNSLLFSNKSIPRLLLMPSIVLLFAIRRSFSTCFVFRTP